MCTCVKHFRAGSCSNDFQLRLGVTSISCSQCLPEDSHWPPDCSSLRPVAVMCLSHCWTFHRNNPGLIRLWKGWPGLQLVIIFIWWLFSRWISLVFGLSMSENYEKCRSVLPKSPEDIQLALIEIFIFKPHFICKQFSGPMGQIQ